MENIEPSGKWVKCANVDCGQRLAPILVHNGRTAIPAFTVGMAAWIYEVEIECPVCGAVRRFNSVPVQSKKGGRQSRVTEAIRLTP